MLQPLLYSTRHQQGSRDAGSSFGAGSRTFSAWMTMARSSCGSKLAISRICEISSSVGSLEAILSRFRVLGTDASAAFAIVVVGGRRGSRKRWAAGAQGSFGRGWRRATRAKAGVWRRSTIR